MEKGISSGFFLQKHMFVKMSACTDYFYDCLCCLCCFSEMDFIEPKIMEWENNYEDPDYIPLYLKMVNNPLYKEMNTHKYVNMAP